MGLPRFLLAIRALSPYNLPYNLSITREDRDEYCLGRVKNPSTSHQEAEATDCKPPQAASTKTTRERKPQSESIKGNGRSRYRASKMDNRRLSKLGGTADAKALAPILGECFLFNASPVP